jgi:hypothetical protein
MNAAVKEYNLTGWIKVITVVIKFECDVLTQCVYSCQWTALFYLLSDIETKVCPYKIWNNA